MDGIDTEKLLADYYTLEAISNSDLSILAKPNGPQLFRAIKIDKTIEIKPTEAMNLGSMIHTLCLEPEQFSHRYACIPNGLDRGRKAGKIAWRCFDENANVHDMYSMKPLGLNRRTNQGKEDYAKFESAIGEREIIDPEDYERAQYFLEELETTRGKTIVKEDDILTATLCEKALWNHEQIAQLLDAGKSSCMIEKPIFFEWNGVQVRCKPDYVNLNAEVILDLKSTQASDPDTYSKSLYNYGSYRQAAFYKHAVLTTMGVNCRFLFGVVDTNEPYSVACYEPDEAMLTRGKQEIEMLLAEYLHRTETNDWVQEWAKGIVPISFPKWVVK